MHECIMCVLSPHSTLTRAHCRLPRRALPRADPVHPAGQVRAGVRGGGGGQRRHLRLRHVLPQDDGAPHDECLRHYA